MKMKKLYFRIKKNLTYLLSFAFIACTSSVGNNLVQRTPLDKIQVATWAQDWRNTPDANALKGFTYANLSARAQTNGGPVGGSPVAETLIDAGVKVTFVVFPCYNTFNGANLPDGDWDREVQKLADQYNATLKDSSGNPGIVIDECYVLDFRNTSFVKEYAKLVASFMKIGQGILFHGGCADLAYETSLAFMTKNDWENWGNGRALFYSEIRKLRPDWEFTAVCDRWGTWTEAQYDGLYFEHIGSSLNPVGSKTYTELSNAGERNVIGLFEADTFAARRRGAAAMAILTDGIFQFGREATVTKNIEHFSIYYGIFSDAAQEISTGVYERVGTHGLVVLNISGSLYDYVDPILGQTFTLIDGDGLSAQFKDKDTGADLGLGNWITNVGL